MTTLADSLVSSSARKLGIRKRADLSARRHRYQGRTYWIIKEPVGLNYFRFQEEEFAILNMLDGRNSLDDIQERFEAEFPPQKITVEELQQFIGTLHRSGLVVADVPGQGQQLKKRAQERWRKELISKFTNILAIRFKGIDPDRLLTWMHPWLKWIYSTWAIVAWALIALTAGSLVLIQFDVFHAKLPGFYQFFNLKNAFWLMIALGASKIVHEFGHGLTCKHFGGECHEMGLMVLVLTPCLYCNVSDSWMLPNKWQRAAIGFAGMYVEIFIASICTFVWWYTEPGMLNHLCLNTMFVCSVSTLVFNGNPLLRYDGYYILSDILEIPNLRQKATDILGRKLGEWCLGLEPNEDPFLPQRNQWLFAIYSVAAAVYRWFVTFSILWFLYKVWEPYRLEVIGQMIAVASLYSLLIQPLWRIGKFFYVPGRLDKVKKGRALATAGILAALLAAFIYLPLPFRVFCTLNVQARSAPKVYVAEPGRLATVHVEMGDEVQPGQLIATLESIDAQIRLQELHSEEAAQKARLDSLERLKFDVPEAALEIPPVRESLEAVRRQIAEQQDDLDRLKIYAPAAGVVLPPSYVPDKPDPTGNLPAWHGYPLEERNVGCFLEEGTVLCEIGNPDATERFEANLVIDQADREFVHEGLQVAVKLDELPWDQLQGEITEISRREMQAAPTELSNKSGGELATQTDAAGVEKPASASYQARVPLNDTEQLLRLGLKGRGKVYAGTQTLGQRFWRYVTQTFNFKL